MLAALGGERHLRVGTFAGLIQRSKWFDGVQHCQRALVVSGLFEGGAGSGNVRGRPVNRCPQGGDAFGITDAGGEGRLVRQLVGQAGRLLVTGVDQAGAGGVIQAANHGAAVGELGQHFRAQLGVGIHAL